MYFTQKKYLRVLYLANTEYKQELQTDLVASPNSSFLILWAFFIFLSPETSQVTFKCFCH